MRTGSTRRTPSTAASRAKEREQHQRRIIQAKKELKILKKSSTSKVEISDKEEMARIDKERAEKLLEIQRSKEDHKLSLKRQKSDLKKKDCKRFSLSFHDSKRTFMRPEL